MPTGSAFLLQSENVLVQSKRFRGKINIQKPRPPHYERALFNAVVQPIYKIKTVVEVCREKQEKKLQMVKIEREPHPYEIILARELREDFESAEMVLICQMNSIKALEWFRFRVALHRNDVKARVHGAQVRKTALKDTKFEKLLELMTVSSCMLFGDASTIGEILKVLRKFPQMILLAGTMSDRILSKNELVDYSTSDLQTVRAQFAASLNTAGGQVLNHLQAHQSNLCNMLDAHAKALGEETAPKPATEEANVNTDAPDTKTE